MAEMQFARNNLRELRDAIRLEFPRNASSGDFAAQLLNAASKLKALAENVKSRPVGEGYIDGALDNTIFYLLVASEAERVRRSAAPQPRGEVSPNAVPYTAFPMPSVAPQ